MGPLLPGQIPDLHIKCVILKGYTPDKWRLITDWSHPRSGNINDGINPDLCSLCYMLVQRVVRTAVLLGKVAKLDIKAVYRLMSVHPDNCPHLGIKWLGSHYMDGMLLFGLRLAPKVFTMVADILDLVTKQTGMAMVDQDPDDLVTLGPPASPECSLNLCTVLVVCEELGILLVVDPPTG